MLPTMFDVKAMLERAEKLPQTKADLEGSQAFAICKSGRIYRYVDLKIVGAVSVQEIPAADFLAELNSFLAKEQPQNP